MKKLYVGNNRFFYIVSVLLMVVLGLASRKYSNFTPAFLANHAGDVIWAMMVYFGFRVLFIRKSVLFAGICSILFSFGIEFSQLYQANWINALRNTTIGALILGKGFISVDLLRYVCGIILAYFLDELVLHRKKTK